jgi:hypothetical protein
MCIIHYRIQPPNRPFNGSRQNPTAQPSVQRITWPNFEFAKQNINQSWNQYFKAVEVNQPNAVDSLIHIDGLVHRSAMSMKGDFEINEENCFNKLQPNKSIWNIFNPINLVILDLVSAYRSPMICRFL